MRDKKADISFSYCLFFPTWHTKARMGNCGSSLNCNKCYANEPIKGCDTEIEINPDIAGIGVSASYRITHFL